MGMWDFDVLDYFQKYYPDELQAPQLDEDGEFAAQYGVKYRSGRFPYGSGEVPFQHDPGFLNQVTDYRKQGYSETEIAKKMGMSTTDFRREVSIAKNEIRNFQRLEAIRLMDEGVKKADIARQLNIAPSTLESLLNKVSAERQSIVNNTADQIKVFVNKGQFMDIGVGAENIMGVSQTKFRTAIKQLENEGYPTYTIQVPQMGVSGTSMKTTVKVICPPGTAWSDVQQNQNNIKVYGGTYTKDGGKTFAGIQKPASISGSRIYIRYAEEGGKDRDGTIELRRGVPDLSLGPASYAQVRIAVDNQDYIKGVALYSDDIPKGYDIVVNTNKKAGTPLHTDPDNPNAKAVLKPMKRYDSGPDAGEFKENPFGAAIRTEDGQIVGQSYYTDPVTGESKLSPINICRQEGDWNNWSKSIASQMLSKQPVATAKKQMRLAYEDAKSEYDKVMLIKNSEVKAQILNELASKYDADAVELKGAAFPRQGYKLLLPVPELKDNEIYAPQYKDGEEVILIRFPHGGTFEIPRLVVNNRNPAGIAKLGKTPADAVGINPAAAQKLSGADYDGDTAIVIPTRGQNLVNSKAVDSLLNFDPDIYELPPERYNEIVDERTKQIEMGKITNLITDMTLIGAEPEEIAAATRHSMVVIDAIKHKYDIKASYRDNHIDELRIKYRGSKDAGASTIVSKASSEAHPHEREEIRYVSQMTEEEKVRYYNGERIYRDTNRLLTKYDSATKDELAALKRAGYGARTPEYQAVVNEFNDRAKAAEDSVKIYAKDPDYTEKLKAAYKAYNVPFVYATDTVAKMYLTNDASTLSSGNQMESVYVTYANQMKALANEARKEARSLSPTKKDKEAAVIYAQEVNSINAKINVAVKNRPLERQAQVLCSNWVRNELNNSSEELDREHMDRLKSQYLGEARRRVGADKAGTRIVLTPKEWEAIEANAVTSNTVLQVLANADSDVIKELAIPREEHIVTDAVQNRIAILSANGYTLSEIAEHVGFSTTTVSKYLNQQKEV